jgi:Kef-type K+ transport system membrane component KefB
MLLAAQILLTLTVAWIFANLARRVGEPGVVGEMVAGIALGPTVLGALSPRFHALVFPPASLTWLRLLGELGVVVFMFSVGLRSDLETIRRNRAGAVLVSYASIATPFLLGLGTAWLLYPRYAGTNTPLLTFALFIGVAMSITAFPVLARILADRNWTNTSVGTIALTCAAVDDVTAWCLLAVITSIAKWNHQVTGVFVTLAAIALFTFVMMRVVKPLLAKVRSRVIVPTITALAAAAVTAAIGVHSMFGAFVAGLSSPLEGADRISLADRFSIVNRILLPLFFAYTGLRTNLAVFADMRTLAICIGVIAVATLGKFGASSLVSRALGTSWRDSLFIGVLMNTRGLVELVVLNVGYDLGIITAPMFSIMVVMALVTTLATTPLLSLIERQEYTLTKCAVTLPASESANGTSTSG